MNIDYYKSFLWPPKKFLQNIDFKENGFWIIEIIPYLENENAISVYTMAEIRRVREAWMFNYQIVNKLSSKLLDALEKENKSQGFTQRSLVSISELIKNTIEHGNKGKIGALAHLGYWFTEQGIVAGIRDEGDFYSNPEIAKKFKEKFFFESTKDIPSGHGIQCLYRYADFLKVVPEQNAIFVGFLFKSLIEE